MLILLIYNNFLPKIITKNRCKLLAKALHTPDNEEEENIDEEDKKYYPRHKIFWPFDNMKKLYQKNIIF